MDAQCRDRLILHADSALAKILILRSIITAHPEIGISLGEDLATAYASLSIARRRLSGITPN